MQALSLENGQLTYQANYPIPQPKADEALIKVTLAGICSTDLEICSGYVPGFHGVLGHEFVGIVEAASGTDWHERRVVGSINIGCGHCSICHQFGPEHCPQRQALGIHNKDGAFADYLTLPIANLHVVPDSVEDETAVFTEPLAAALRIREQVQVKPTAKTAVIGPGRLGLLVAQVLALDGTDVTLLGRHRESLTLPAKWGLATGLAPDYADDSFEFVVEATGNEAGFAQALRLIRPRGTLILKSTFAGNVQLNLTKLVVSEITVVGSRCGPFAPALRLLAATAIDVTSLIDAQYALRDGVAALTHAANPGVRKVLIRP